ncbi:hypothetical protein QNO07_07200 [Streptomyces sp. 549]|uniref:hypothetical protein n=1 Tax=Streptomyces sp. 549 TaxID=3049076 RepID=UPI0024C40EAC|nr:hypothetical protein [Streptomyces sp. 549]MDK1473210.1 hypothetical protein [Streptomyces sp. 549]
MNSIAIRRTSVLALSAAITASLLTLAPTAAHAADQDSAGAAGAAGAAPAGRAVSGEAAPFELAAAAPAAKKGKVYRATVRCDIVTNKGGHTVRKETGKGKGKTKVAAVNDAKKNVKVPKGYYKRHCKEI